MTPSGTVPELLLVWFRKLDVLQETASEISSQTGNQVTGSSRNQNGSRTQRLTQSVSVLRSMPSSVTSETLRPWRTAWTRWWR